MTLLLKRTLLTEAAHNRLITLAGAEPDLVAALEQATLFTPATNAEIDAARRLYGSDEIEVDDYNVGTSDPADGTGLWVAAWVWVPA